MNRPKYLAGATRRSDRSDDSKRSGVNEGNRTPGLQGHNLTL
jgi:hypothetical protein